ncbi:hypothetical protein Ga0609869_000001, partial [Rhodovulum iodosum]
MRALAELSLIAPLAAGLHLAAFGLAGAPQGGAPGGAGQGGESALTLAAAPPALAALADAWRRPPATGPAPAAPPAPPETAAARHPVP